MLLTDSKPRIHRFNSNGDRFLQLRFLGLYNDILKKIDEEQCPFSLETPSKAQKLVLFKEYTEDGKTWHTIPSYIFIYNKESFEDWIRMTHRNNPANREELDSPTQYNDHQTRYRYCKVHGDDGSLVLPALREVRDKLCTALQVKSKLENNYENDESNGDTESNEKTYGRGLTSGCQFFTAPPPSISPTSLHVDTHNDKQSSSTLKF